MFVRYFAELPYPLAPVEAALLRSPSEWIPGVAEHAEDIGEHLLAEVGFGQGTRMARKVVIELKDPIRFPSRTVLPMSWHAADHEALYPKLEADIEVASLGSDKTQLSVSARYQPPLGRVGKAIDKTFMHRVAEATIKDFVDQACGRLLATLGSATATGAAAD